MQKTPLTGRVALVTGSARRIGAEITKTLHAHGMNIVLHYNLSEEEAANLCHSLNEKRSHSAIAIRADLQNNEAAKNLVERSQKAWGRLDVLINNASRFYKTPMGDVTEFAWDDLMNSNVKTPFFLAQAAAPYLTMTKGTIINIADIHGIRPLLNYSVYCISKAALLMSTKVLANELGPDVRVNAVSPGSVLWPEGANALDDYEKQAIIDNTALLRAGSPEDIATAVLFFIKDATYVTGQVINVDGGRMLHW